MSAPGLLREIVSALDDADIPHMLVGSFASTSHGAPRAMQDIDIVIDPTPEQLERFVTAFDDQRFYVSPSAQIALQARDQFNLIDMASGWKVNLIVRKDRPFSRCEFDRRQRMSIFGVGVFVATAEDTVLAKLEWASAGGSERQVADAAAVLAVLAERIDHACSERWAEDLGVTELLDRAKAG